MRSDRVKKGLERAPHRSLLKATGLNEEDIRRPFIAVCNSYTDVIPGHAHLAEVGKFVKQCIRAAGGTPFEFSTIGVCDGIAMGHYGMKYSLPSREIIADAVETMVEAHQFDAMICIPNCDKIIPGMLMAAMRCNIPTIFASGGPMEAGRMPDGRAADLISVFAGVGAVTVGKMKEEELRSLEEHACPGCGSCSGMFTANSMNCLCEAVGMALPGNGTILATSLERKRLYQKASRRIVEMAREFSEQGDAYPFLPRAICTHDALDNAMVLDMAMGGSTNTLLHMLAVAHDAGVQYDIPRVNDLSRRTPNVCKVSPSSAYHMEDVARAGGIHTILGEVLRGRPGLIKMDAPTVSGQTLGEQIATWDIRTPTVCREALEMAAVGSSGKRGTPAMTHPREADTVREITDLGFDPMDCIRPCDKAYSQEGGLTVLYGNLAPEGAVVKSAGVKPAMMRHTGPAVIFESQEDACAGLLNGKVKAGDVVIIRNEGPKGGPGMQEMLSPTSYIKGMGLDDKCALITDGRFSGGTAGACIGHVSPEAVAGGPIGVLRNGDVIEIDIPGQKLHVQVSDAEFEERAKHYKAPEPRFKTGYLAKYASMATSANTGAVLEWRH
jgi:dihydroxy-acid dehydratase